MSTGSWCSVASDLQDLYCSNQHIRQERHPPTTVNTLHLALPEELTSDIPTFDCKETQYWLQTPSNRLFLSSGTPALIADRICFGKPLQKSLKAVTLVDLYSKKGLHTFFLPSLEWRIPGTKLVCEEQTLPGETGKILSASESVEGCLSIQSQLDSFLTGKENCDNLGFCELLLGFTSGVSAVAGALYTTEIVDAEVRGIMYNILCLNVTLGGLFAVGVGYFVRWFHLAMICTIPPSLLLIGSFFLPDSPTLLVVRGEKIEALRVLRKLRGPHANLKSEIEVIEMKNSFRADGWQKLLNRYIVKRIIIVVMLMAFLFLCGNDVFIVHTARILREAGYPMDADIGTTTVAVVRIVGMLVSFLLVDRMGRRPSLVASYAISSVFLIVLGVYVHLTETATPEDTTSSALGWVPLVSVIMISFGLQIGAQPVTFLLSAEYFPTSVRGQFSNIYLNTLQVKQI
ncbi:Facilitated trehalose transporter Tret1 [Portunus trituberculatus]|uniref:Facilitated trehalose transporter Tret1 n=1 Tax=Portunus trituberculatus TaxID=210409 RepID=A0A5B7D322_PORTR|nr:Facilitated trehalose transporter Tret1 [Portunus trituberculatus]